MDLFPLKSTKPACAKDNNWTSTKDIISISNGRKIRKTKCSSREGMELGRKAGGRPVRTCIPGAHPHPGH